jgi:hypothetical protein
MTPPKSEDGYIRMAEDEFEELLARAAERGARRALADVGLEGKEAALDVRDLRSLIECIRFVRRTAVQTAVRPSSPRAFRASRPGSPVDSRDAQGTHRQVSREDSRGKGSNGTVSGLSKCPFRPQNGPSTGLRATSAHHPAEPIAILVRVSRSGHSRGRRDFQARR